MTDIDDASDMRLITTAFLSQLKPAVWTMARNPTITIFWIIAGYNASCAYSMSTDMERVGGKYHAIIASELQSQAVLTQTLYWVISLTAFGFALVLMALKKIEKKITIGGAQTLRHD